ncbi:sideroflexin-2-like [Saccoglossus kowalevskii]|uniref:Sidoreflexin n=1 Tax=Saccoglossus kowalevskii TaxID=10224 RepID=A0ABM0MBV7_SACKO|nr:PREDICTED: sideroflexin-2-like [Saccoglossus kowalevskii]
MSALTEDQPTLSETATVLNSTSLRLDLDKPRWDQSTFMGRLKHFFNITDSRNSLYSEKELDDAKELIMRYKSCTEPPGTTEEQLYHAQKLYMSAFHPDTGDKMNVIGRMSFQVPGGMLITGGMLQFYKTWPSVVLWQWINQSFNALVNYTNRNAASPISNKQIGLSYVCATGSALVASVGLNSLTKTAPPLLARWVPFGAVAAANIVNIPLMRQQELLYGINLFDENGNEVGKSKRAAVKAVTQVAISRITMCAPGMIILPIIMEYLEKYPSFRRIKILHAPIQILLVGCFLCFMTPAACSLFPQKCSMKVSNLEPEVRKELQLKYGDLINKVYFNKGL